MALAELVLTILLNTAPQHPAPPQAPHQITPIYLRDDQYLGADKKVVFDGKLISLEKDPKMAYLKQKNSYQRVFGDS